MKVFCPSSITCFFSPVLSDDPKRSGSIGVGIALKPGLVVSVWRGRREVRLNGREVRVPTVDTVMDALGFDGRVEFETDLPLGCGFGVSGAMALGLSTALTGCRFKAADIAHEAEVLNGTGLGDVTTQCYGGVVARINAATPSACKVETYLWDLTLDVVVFGPLPTGEVLRDFRGIEGVGRECLKEFLRNPSVENLFKQSKRFSEETGLIDVDERIRDAVEAVESEGGMASMVMLGKAVFALKGDVLREIGGLYLKMRVDFCGVRLLD